MQVLACRNGFGSTQLEFIIRSVMTHGNEPWDRDAESMDTDSVAKFCWGLSIAEYNDLPLTWITYKDHKSDEGDKENLQYGGPATI